MKFNMKYQSINLTSVKQRHLNIVKHCTGGKKKSTEWEK